MSGKEGTPRTSFVTLEPVRARFLLHATYYRGTGTPKLNAAVQRSTPSFPFCRGHSPNLEVRSAKTLAGGSGRSPLSPVKLHKGSFLTPAFCSPPTCEASPELPRQTTRV